MRLVLIFFLLFPLITKATLETEDEDMVAILPISNENQNSLANKFDGNCNSKNSDDDQDLESELKQQQKHPKSFSITFNKATCQSLAMGLKIVGNLTLESIEKFVFSPEDTGGFTKKDLSRIAEKLRTLPKLQVIITRDIEETPLFKEALIRNGFTTADYITWRKDPSFGLKHNKITFIPLEHL